jgi:hypothetical protein
MQPLWRTKPSHFSIFDLSRAGEALSKNVKFRMRQTSGSPYARRHFAEKKVVRFNDTWLCSRWFRQIAAWRGKHLPFFTAEWRAIAKSGGRILYHPPVTTRRLIKKQIGNLLRRGVVLTAKGRPGYVKNFVKKRAEKAPKTSPCSTLSYRKQTCSMPYTCPVNRRVVGSSPTWGAKLCPLASDTVGIIQ